uniref:Uncharacterized protein n=1 Tax=Oryza glaberrima TaxID=4538 RepID=I1PM34_ORYGL
MENSKPTDRDVFGRDTIFLAGFSVLSKQITFLGGFAGSFVQRGVVDPVDKLTQRGGTHIQHRRSRLRAPTTRRPPRPSRPPPLRPPGAPRRRDPPRPILPQHLLRR